MKTAVDQLWPLSGQLLAPPVGRGVMLPQETWPASSDLARAWEAEVRAYLRDSDLTAPEGLPPGGPAREVHTEHLPALLEALQSVARLEPGAAW